MKLYVRFNEEERERVEMVARLVKSLFHIERTRSPGKKEDGNFHLYISTSKH